MYANLCLAGLALLTLMVNAIGAAPLLSMLGMTRIPAVHNLLLQNVKERLIEHAEEVRWDGIDAECMALSAWR